MMKTKTIPILVSLLLACFAFAEPGANLKWDYVAADLADIGSFRIYLGLESGNYTEVTEVIPPFDTTTAADLATIRFRLAKPGATYYAAVTAVNTLGLESDYSNEITFKMPGKPTNFRRSGP